MRLALLALPAVFALTTACVADLGKDRSEATVQEVPAAEAPPAAPSGSTLAVDVGQSSIRALGAKVTATHPIDFHRWSGTMTVDGDAVSAVSFEVDMASLEADHPKLTKHLLNEDFFDVPNHPTSTFRSTAVTEGAKAEGATHTVAGDLTIRGKTKRVTFPATLTASAVEVRAQAEFVIDRQDFGVAYPGRPDDLVQDKVVLTVSFVAPKG